MAVTLPDRLMLDRLKTPIGEALLITDEDGRLRAFDWDDFDERLRRQLRRHYGARVPLADGRAPQRIRAALDAYFAGDLAQLDGIECGTAGTPFQRAVWAALRAIPVGQTLSYGALAAKLNAPKAMRAVGLANGANPIGVVVPCHRVIGADGSLTGYGGGLERKRWLLAHEGAAFVDRMRQRPKAA
jgi:methylated-DNA-[protein]-cysteine S-methyltransferase